ncbi:hypothetical protein Tco_0373264 [Tanacetum coccineum]
MRQFVRSFMLKLRRVRGAHSINIPPPILNASLAVGGISGQAPSIGDMARDNVSQPSGGMHSYSGEQSAPCSDAFNKRHSSSTMIDSGNVQEFVGDEFGSQNSIHEGNSSHDVGGVVSGRQPSISDMARENMSSGGTHSYSREHSSSNESRNPLNKRDSSSMMIDSDYVQESVGDKFGWNDLPEVSSKV